MASYSLATQLSGQSDTSASTSLTQWGYTDSSGGSRPSSSQQWEEFRPSCSSSAACALRKAHEESTGQCLATLEAPHGGNVVSLALSGDLIFAGSDASDIRVWRLSHAQQLEEGEATAKFVPVATRFRLKPDGGAVKALVAVQDRLYSAHQDRKLRVWNKAALPHTPSDHVHHDKQEVVQQPAEDKDREKKNKPVATLPTIKDYVVSCLPPNNYVQVRRHHKELWIKHADTVSVLVAGAGVLYSGSWDKSVKVWRLADHKCLESLAAHDDAVNALVVDQANAFLYSGGADAKIKVWARILPDGSYIASATPLHHQENVAPSPIPPRLLRSQASATNLLSPSLLYSQQFQQTPPRKGSNYMSSPADPRLLQNRPLHRGGSKQAHAHHHHHFKGTSPLHPHASNQHGSHILVATLEGHGSAINALALSPDGSLLYSASADCSISVWEREDSARHMSFATVLRGHQQAVLCLAVSGMLYDNSYLLCSGSADGSIRVWRCAASRSLHHVGVVVLLGHKGSVRSLAVQQVGEAGAFLYSGGVDAGVKVWWLPCSTNNSSSCHTTPSRDSPSPALYRQQARFACCR